MAEARYWTSGPNEVVAGPATGDADGPMGPRALVAADTPDLSSAVSVAQSSANSGTATTDAIARSEATSGGLQASLAASQATSGGLAASVASSKGDSAGVRASIAQSTAAS